MTDATPERSDRVSARAPVVIDVDASGSITSVTDGVAALLGWAPIDLVGRRLVDIIPERFHGPHRQAFDRFVETGWSRHEGQALELPALMKDGTERDIQLMLTARSSPGGPRSVTGVLRAIGGDPESSTEALVERVRHTLQHLVAADRPIREVLGAAVEPVALALDWPIGVLWAFDPWVERLTALHVWEREPGTHPTYVEATSHVRFARNDGFASQVWETSETWWSTDLASEPQFRRAASAAADSLRSGLFAPIVSGAGMIGVLELVDEAERGMDAEAHAALRAVTAEIGRHLAERLRRETEAIHRQRLQIALSGGQMGIWTFHVPTGQVTWDAMLEAAHGIEPGSFGGTFEAFASAVHPDDRDEVLAIVQRAIEDRSRFDVDYRTVTHDGSIRWISGSGAPLLDRDGELQMMTGVGRDATDEVLDQELLQRRASGAALAADVGRALVRAEDLPARLQQVADAIVDHFDVAFARIWHLERESDVLVLRASSGLYRHLDGGHARIRVGEFKIGRIAAGCRAHVTNELLDDPQLSDPAWAEREGMQAFAGFPLMVHDRCVGVLGVFARHELTGDVIGSLASITDSVAVAIVQQEEAQRVAELLEQTEAQRARAEALLVERQRVASVLQESLLPPTLPQIDRLDVAAAYRPGVEEVGGDFYDLFPMGDERWGFMIGDVCGRGPEAARYTAVARHSLRTALSLGGGPATALAALDESLRTVGTDGRFCTAVCGIVTTADAETSVVRIAVAGHPPPLVVRRDGEIDEIDSTGPLLGVVPDSAFDELSFDLGRDDMVVLYTDGIIEARGVDGLFGADRLRTVAASLAGETARTVTDGLLGAVNEYDSMQTHDDLAVLTLRRR